MSACWLCDSEIPSEAPLPQPLGAEWGSRRAQVGENERRSWRSDLGLDLRTSSARVWVTVFSVASFQLPWPSSHQDEQSCWSVLVGGQQREAFSGDRYKEISPSVPYNGRKSGNRVRWHSWCFDADVAPPFAVLPFTFSSARRGWQAVWKLEIKPGQLGLEAWEISVSGEDREVLPWGKRLGNGRVVACEGVRKAKEENVIGQAVRAKISNGNRAPPWGLPECIIEDAAGRGGPRERGLWEICCKVGMTEVVSGVSRCRLVSVGLLCLVSSQFFRLW